MRIPFLIKALHRNKWSFLIKNKFINFKEEFYNEHQKRVYQSSRR